ncbi:unnamed protein product [Closterium sp. Naga37s-1]|nr:unnamed protein product [Closterium sp. Naga37s-1]
MTTDALALVATALAAASPGGVPGNQVPALLRAASLLAGHEATSPSSRGRGEQRREKRRSSRGAVFHPPPGRAPACLRPRQQQPFRRTQRPSSHPLRPFHPSRPRAAAVTTAAISAAATGAGDAASPTSTGSPCSDTGTRSSASRDAVWGVTDGEVKPPPAAAAVPPFLPFLPFLFLSIGTI